MSVRARVIAALVAFGVGAGTVVVFDALVIRGLGAIALAAAVAVGTSAIVTPEALGPESPAES